jgi:hypothetical protein
MAEFSSQSMVIGRRDCAGSAYAPHNGMYANSQLEIKVMRKKAIGSRHDNSE